jgi:nitrogen PTS system EIIA component
MKLVDLIQPDAVKADLESSGKMDVLAELGGLLSRSCPNLEADEITRILVERERLATTGVGDGVAIPHGKAGNLDELAGAVGLSRTGIPFDAVDGEPVRIFFALIAPLNSTGEHLKALARISRLLKDPDFRERLTSCRGAEEIHDTIAAADGGH